MFEVIEYDGYRNKKQRYACDGLEDFLNDLINGKIDITSFVRPLRSGLTKIILHVTIIINIMIEVIHLIMTNQIIMIILDLMICLGKGKNNARIYNIS